MKGKEPLHVGSAISHLDSTNTITALIKLHHRGLLWLTRGDPSHRRKRRVMTATRGNENTSDSGLNRPDIDRIIISRIRSDPCALTTTSRSVLLDYMRLCVCVRAWCVTVARLSSVPVLIIIRSPFKSHPPTLCPDPATQNSLRE